MGAESFGPPKSNKQETALDPEKEGQKQWEAKLGAAQNANELAAAIEQVPGGTLYSQRGGPYEAKGLVAEMRALSATDIEPAVRSDVGPIVTAALRIRREKAEEDLKKIRGEK